VAAAAVVLVAATVVVEVLVLVTAFWCGGHASQRLSKRAIGV